MSVQRYDNLSTPLTPSYKHNDFCPFVRIYQVEPKTKIRQCYIQDGLEIKYRPKIDGLAIRLLPTSMVDEDRVRGHCNVTFEQLKLLLPAREYIKKVYFDDPPIEVVDFILENCPNVTDIGGIRQFNLTLHQQVCLIQLKLTRLGLFCLTLTEEMAAKWAKVIGNMPTLKCLEIRKIKMNEVAAEKFLVGLEQCPVVKLRLSYSTSLPAFPLGRSLRKMKSLQEIYLDCEKYTVDEVSDISQQISTLPNLFNLIVKCPCSFEAILQTIQQSSSIEMIGLHCCCFTEIQLNQILDLIESTDRKIIIGVGAKLGSPCASDAFRERIERVNWA